MAQRTKQQTAKLTLGRWLIEKTDTKAWRAGRVFGVKHPKVSQTMIDAIGYRELLAQAAELEKEGIISVDWGNMRSDIRKIHFPVENMERLCRREKMENPQTGLKNARENVLRRQEETESEWLHKYYRKLLLSLDEGTVPPNANDDDLLKCLNALAALEKDIWKRQFSARVLGDSKRFETDCEERVLTVLRDYSPKYIVGMMNDELLAEHRIFTYSQTLEWKGGIVYGIGEAQISTADMVYGTVLNAQTLTHACPLSLERVRKMITIENKANYESMIYDEEILYLYTHGFPSPKERVFLKKLAELADDSVEMFHWSDMDFGGIRIFQYMKENIFPRIHPMAMDKATYEQALQAGAGIALAQEKRALLEKIDAGELEELKQCILTHNMEIEQENLISAEISL